MEPDDDPPPPAGGVLTTAVIASRARPALGRKAVWEWIVDGVIGPAGVPVRLAATAVGGRYVVRPRDLDAFLRVWGPEAVKRGRPAVKRGGRARPTRAA